MIRKPTVLVNFHPGTNPCNGCIAVIDEINQDPGQAGILHRKPMLYDTRVVLVALVGSFVRLRR
jgi:hypothetical protein